MRCMPPLGLPLTRGHAKLTQKRLGNLKLIRQLYTNWLIEKWGNAQNEEYNAILDFQKKQQYS